MKRLDIIWPSRFCTVSLLAYQVWKVVQPELLMVTLLAGCFIELIRIAESLRKN